MSIDVREVLLLLSLSALLSVCCDAYAFSLHAKPSAAVNLSPEAQAAVDKVDWWKKTNYYHIYVRSFQDSDGDGNGDLRGIINRLDYLQRIGVETLLMAPFYSSPMKDCGYDVDDYKSINPMFGTMKDYDDLVAELRRRGMKMVVDFVPNHTSDLHPWFECSEKALEDPKRCGKYKDYYVWVDPHVDPKTGEIQTDKPPNNWISLFYKMPAWTYSKIRKQWYLHQFLKEQPDLNFTNPQVRDEFRDIARFWLRKGADGLRVDAILHLIEAEGFPDEPLNPHFKEGDYEYERLIHVHTKSLPQSVDYVQDWRDVLDEPEFLDPKTGRSSKVLMTEAYDVVEKLVPYYGRAIDDKLADLPFNTNLFGLDKHNWSPGRILEMVYAWMEPTKALGWPKEDGMYAPWICWVTGNHDNSRIVNKVGYNNAVVLQWLSYLLPGVPLNYAGNELHMQDSEMEDIPKKTLLEGEPTRLPFRAPMAWNHRSPSAGFSSTSDIWMPLNRDYFFNNVNSQLASDQINPLRLFVKLQEIRESNMPIFLFGDLVFYDTENENETISEEPSKIFAMARLSKEYGNIMLLTNCDPFDVAVVRLKPTKTFYDGVTVVPPKRGTLLTYNYETVNTLTGKSINSKINIDGRVLLPSQAILIKF